MTVNQLIDELRTQLELIPRERAIDRVVVFERIMAGYCRDCGRAIRDGEFCTCAIDS